MCTLAILLLSREYGGISPAASITLKGLQTTITLDETVTRWCEGAHMDAQIVSLQVNYND